MSRFMSGVVFFALLFANSQAALSAACTDGVGTLDQFVGGVLNSSCNCVASATAVSSVRVSSATDLVTDSVDASECDVSGNVCSPVSIGDSIAVGTHIFENTSPGGGELYACDWNGSRFTGPRFYTPPPTYSVGGPISGLSGSVTLQNNGGDDLTLNGNGTYAFNTTLIDGGSYNVTVSVQPTGQTCTVSNPSGTIPGANVTNVAVTCVNDPVPTYSVGGTVSGVNCGGPPGCLWLENNGGDDIFPDNGPFTFPTELTDGSGYSVTVAGKPAEQTCTVTNGSGTISGANVTNVAVNCVTGPSPTYSVGGAVSGLSGSVTLQNNGGDDLIVNSVGSFNFSTQLADSGAYDVTVLTQPSGQTCAVTNGSGTISGANVANVAVDCVDDVPPPPPPPPPPSSPSQPIPTLSEWALITLAIILGFMGLVRVRRIQ